MNVYFARHTSVDLPAGICYGQSEVPLSRQYPNELLELQKKLKTIRQDAPFDSYISSPLQRCKQLAEDLAQDAVVRTDPRLLELSFGDWELQSWDRIDSNNARYWAEHFDRQPCPNGESYDDLRKRSLSFWNDLSTQSTDNASILVVTHGGFIRCLLATVLAIPIRNAFNLGVDYGSLSCITEANDTCTVQFINR